MKKHLLFSLLLLAAAVLLLAGCGAKYSWDSERLNYNITGEAPANATLYVTRKGEKVKRAAEGETLYVNLVPDTGYERESITVNGEVLTGSQFTMPAGDVTIAATVRPVVKTITVDPSLSGGTVTADRTEAMWGDTVTLTVTPDADYALIERSLTVNGAEIYRGSPTEKTQITFRMPPHDVRVTARFSKAVLTIKNLSEYQSFAQRVNKGNDFRGWRIVLEDDIGTAEAPVTVIAGDASDKAFAGTIEGGGHTVYVDLNGTGGTGLIGYSNGATVKDLTVAGRVSLTAESRYAGGFIGLVQWANGRVTTLENCVNLATVNVTAASNAGGFVGRTFGHLTVTGCENGGDVSTAGNYAAGVVGYVNNSDTAGAGAPAVTVTDTVNTGAVTGNTGVGGIVGLFHRGAADAVHRLTNVSNTGRLTGTSQVGGIVGVITSQAAKGFDITITYREAGLTDENGADRVIGADNNRKVTSVTQLTSGADA